ncbi:MAG: GIY-YIG nuclease family protein [Kordiimonadaceae bacterium]|nr:GIY-YIG nuclease family protein [Kordiimonadaceae bacterium]
MNEPYSIEIYIPNGDPEGLRIIRQKVWSVECIYFPRSEWKVARLRPELDKTGIYILTGYSEADPDIPLIYIGQTDNLRDRIEAHIKGPRQKIFWNNAAVLTSANDFLNTAYAGWLERFFHKRATDINRCKLENGNTPPRPSLSEAEEATLFTYAKQALQILPLVGIKAFEEKKIVHTKGQRALNHTEKKTGDWRQDKSAWDTVIVPAKQEGFQQVFLDENKWRAIRIGGGMLDQLKYIAAYQVKPVMAITHVAEIDRIEPYGDTGKYELVFKKKAQEIPAIPLGHAPSGAMQGSRYTSYTALQNAKSIKDLLFN